MKLMRGGCALLIAITLGVSNARAQIGEVQLGGFVNYGIPDAFGPGAGIVTGVAAGRLAYVGVHWSYQRGSSHARSVQADPVDITNRVQVFAFDLGVLVPVHAFELVPGASLGITRLTQIMNGSGALAARSATAHATEFFVAPSCALHVHTAGLVLIPEMQVYLGGRSDLAFAPSARGLVSSLRIVVPIEVGRIRH